MARARRKRAKPEAENTDVPGTTTPKEPEVVTDETTGLQAVQECLPEVEPVPEETTLPEPAMGERLLTSQDEPFVIDVQGLSPEEAARILERRARDLARVPAPEEQGESVEVVTFSLTEETYAIEVRYVEQITLLEKLTPVPCTPDFVVGVVNLRGRILSILDIHRFLGLEGITPSNGAQVIAVSAAGLEVGLLVDQVHGVRPLPLSELNPPLPTTNRNAAPYTFGVTPDMAVFIDLAALLKDERIIVREEVGS